MLIQRFYMQSIVHSCQVLSTYLHKSSLFLIDKSLYFLIRIIYNRMEFYMKQTALHEYHVSLGAKMGEFAGYDMPLLYEKGVMEEHLWTRSHAGVFDVSHMGQIQIEGEGVDEFLEAITPSAFQNKAIGRAQYTVLLNEEGGIIDDLIITRMDKNSFFAVINAGCKEKDIAWIKSKLPSHLNFYEMKDKALIAIQGRWAERIVHEILDYRSDDLPYMHLDKATTKYGVPFLISRLGYTGEDGFEISIPNNTAAEIFQELAEHSEATPVGLAARDSLRLEMGYALYGHDIDATTSPVEADLTWIIRKENRNFIGAERVVRELEQGTARKRVGIRLLDKGVAREGAAILNESGEKVGELTSGGFSPSLKESIGQGYIETSLAQPGQKIFVDVRGRKITAEVAKMPFVEPKTKSMKKKAA